MASTGKPASALDLMQASKQGGSAAARSPVRLFKLSMYSPTCFPAEAPSAASVLQAVGDPHFLTAGAGGAMDRSDPTVALSALLILCPDQELGAQRLPTKAHADVHRLLRAGAKPFATTLLYRTARATERAQRAFGQWRLTPTLARLRQALYTPDLLFVCQPAACMAAACGDADLLKLLMAEYDTGTVTGPGPAALYVGRIGGGAYSRDFGCYVGSLLDAHLMDSRGGAAVLKCLLQAGCDPRRVLVHGIDVVEDWYGCLLEHTTIDRLPHPAVMTCWVRIVVASAPVMLEAADSSGLRPLHRALLHYVRSDIHAAVEALIAALCAAGADVNACAVAPLGPFRPVDLFALTWGWLRAEKVSCAWELLHAAGADFRPLPLAVTMPQASSPDKKAAECYFDYLSLALGMSCKVRGVPGADALCLPMLALKCDAVTRDTVLTHRLTVTQMMMAVVAEVARRNSSAVKAPTAAAPVAVAATS